MEVFNIEDSNLAMALEHLTRNRLVICRYAKSFRRWCVAQDSFSFEAECKAASHFFEQHMALVALAWQHAVSDVFFCLFFLAKPNRGSRCERDGCLVEYEVQDKVLQMQRDE
jgi:hypothetical protein